MIVREIPCTSVADIRFKYAENVTCKCIQSFYFLGFEEPSADKDARRPFQEKKIIKR